VPTPLPRVIRLRAPLLLALAALLLLEAVGGLVILFVRVAWGATPGVTLHVAGGLAFTVVYAIYQIAHWNRVAPWRKRPDYVLGLIAATTVSATDLTGLWLGWIWWTQRLDGTGIGHYPVALAAAHTLGTMLALSFASAHLAAVLARDRAGA
jgi:hypothetical protein